MADREERQRVVTAVSNLSASLNKMVQDGRDSYKEGGENINDFVKSCGKENLYGLLTVYPVQLYAECFKNLGVESRKELESLWSRYFSTEEMQSSVKELLLAEEGYRAFIEELDQIMAAHEEKTALPVASIGKHLHSDVTFTKAGTGEAVSLMGLLKKSPYTLFVLRKHYV